MSAVNLLARVFAFSIVACAGDPVGSGETTPPPPPPAEIAIVDGDGADGSITLSPQTTYQTIDGFGTSLRMFDDPHINGQPHDATTGGIVMTAAERDTIYDLLYSQTRGIGLNRLRIAISEPGWQTVAGGPIVADTPYPGPQGTAGIEFIRQALLRNPDLRTGFQIGRFDEWVNNKTPPRVVAEYIKSTLDFAKSRGHEPEWVGIQNEPSLARTAFSGANLRDIMIELQAILKADGRYRTTSSAPDDVADNLGAPKAATILADPVARSFLSSLSIHLYGDASPDQMAALSKQSGLPLWMTEFHARSGRPNIAWASEIVHEMLVTYDCAAVDMLFGFLGAPSASSADVSYIRLNSDGTAYRGYTLNSSYFQMGHWSRYVTRGSVRIGATSTMANVKVSAFTKGGKKVIVLINTSNSVTPSLTIPGGNYRLIRTQMSGTDRLANKGLFRTAVRLAPESITTLIEQ
jgi:O-glycosyl hydrolase